MGFCMKSTNHFWSTPGSGNPPQKPRGDRPTTGSLCESCVETTMVSAFSKGHLYLLKHKIMSITPSTSKMLPVISQQTHMDPSKLEHVIRMFIRLSFLSGAINLQF